jgi:hypothetical protein
MSFLIYRDHDSDIHNHVKSSQPQAILDLESLDFNQSIPPVHDLEKASLENSHDDYDHHCRELEHGPAAPGQTSFSERNNSRLRRFLLPALFVFALALVGFLAWSCFNGIPATGVILMKREGESNGGQFGSTHT